MRARDQRAVALLALAIKLLLLLPPVREVVLVDDAVGRGGVHPHVALHPGDAGDWANVPTKSDDLL